MASKSIKGPVKIEALKDTNSVGPPANSSINNPQPTRGGKFGLNPNDAKYNPQPMHGKFSLNPNGAKYRQQFSENMSISLNPNATKNRPQPPRGKFSLNPNATDQMHQQQSPRLGKTSLRPNQVKNRQQAMEAKPNFDRDTMSVFAGKEVSMKKFAKKLPRSKK